MTIPSGKRFVIAASLTSVLALSAAPGEIDRHCWNAGGAEDICQILTFDEGSVVYNELGFRRLVIGKYVSAAQRFVPRAEAPIRDLRSSHGWHIVVSAFLQREQGESGAMLRIRFFGPRGEPRGKAEVLMTLEEAEVGELFGGGDDILAVQSNEEHSYNSTADIWLLPHQGKPIELLEMNATISKFSKTGERTPPGVWIKRQTYDGVHAETKGWVDEFWVWNPAKKRLTSSR